MNCPVCNTQIEADARECPQCHSNLEAHKHVENVGKMIKTQKMTIIIISIVLVLCVVGLIMNFVFSDSNKGELDQLKAENHSLTEEVVLLKTNISELNQQVVDLKKKRSEQLAQEPEKEVTIPKNSSTYIVKKGDTLWDIAQAMYGDSFQWERIASANNISEPKLLQVGTKLIINN